LQPVPYDDTGQIFVLADHPISSIVSVAVDDSPVTAYRLRHAPDTTGRTVTFLDLQTAIQISKQSLSATINGLLHPITGRLMTNPADVFWDLMQWATGQSVDRDRFALWGSVCQRVGLEVVGVVNDSGATIRALLDTIADSCGSLWSGAMPDFGRLLPEIAIVETQDIASLPRQAISSVLSESRMDGIATVVTVRFGYDWAVGDFTGSVTYHASEAVKQFGSVEKIIDAPWCPSSRQAAHLAEAWCKRLAGPRWTSTIDGDISLADISPGAIVAASHPLLPEGQITGGLATGIDRDYESGAMTITVDYPAGPAPAVEIHGYSGRFTQAAPVGTKVVIGAGSITLVIADDSGKILSGAIATMDGTQTAIADASGRVTFSGLSAGKHKIEIRASGQAPFAIEETL
jgi:hypothetical protein